MKKNNNPIVSVIINCYNGSKYIEKALESALSQSYKNLEIIVWDNQSTDKSASIFNSYNDARQKYCYAPEHTDLGGGRAHAFGQCLGEFVAILDTDDLWLPCKLEKQIPLFEDEDVGIVISDTLFLRSSAIRQIKQRAITMV